MGNSKSVFEIQRGGSEIRGPFKNSQSGMGTAKAVYSVQTVDGMSELPLRTPKPEREHRTAVSNCKSRIGTRESVSWLRASLWTKKPLPQKRERRVEQTTWPFALLNHSIPCNRTG